jgi:signal peptidase I
MSQIQPEAVSTIGKTRMLKRRARARVKDYIEAVLIAVVIAVILRVFVIQAYRVESGSMEDTLQVGDFLFVNKFVYHFEDPMPGDIIVFEYPLNPARDYIKRVVAIEGQTVEVVGKKVYIDGVLAAEPEESKHIDMKLLPRELSSRDYFGPKQVPPGQMFVMGDNRDDSKDSRFWGFVDRKLVKGKAMFIYFSWLPDPNAPKWSSPYIDKVFSIFFYNLFHFPSRLGWPRLFRAV